MKYIKSLYNYHPLNEGISYSTLGEIVTYQEVADFIASYYDEGDFEGKYAEYIAILGKRTTPDGNIEYVDPDDFSPLDQESYVVYQVALDYAVIVNYLKKSDHGIEDFRTLFSINPVKKDKLIRKILNNSKSSEKFGFIWIYFDEHKNLIGAESFASNEVSWFTDEMGLAHEHSQEYQDYMDDDSEYWAGQNGELEKDDEE